MKLFLWSRFIRLGARAFITSRSLLLRAWNCSCWFESNKGIWFVFKIPVARTSFSVFSIVCSCFLWFAFAQTSSAANPAPNTTSAKIPAIKILHPHFCFNFASLLSPKKLERCTFISSSSASFSSQSPKKTISPPMLASIGIKPDQENKIEKTNSDIVAIKINTTISLVVLLTIGIGLIIRFPRNRD